MKRVFTDISHVAHLWASQAQDEARNSSGNFYFNGDTIYSYGRHFPIAQIYNKDSNIVFLTTRTYSNTTAKHIGTVRYAVNHKKIFHVSKVQLNRAFSEDHSDNVKSYLHIIESLILKQQRARKYDYRGEINGWIAELREYVKLFSLKSTLTKSQRSLLKDDPTGSIIKDFSSLVIKIEKEEAEEQRKKKEQDIKEWTGDNDVKYKKNKVYLRYDEHDDTIETSKGAEVPTREAKVLYYRIKEGKDIKGFTIGYYTVIGINGVLKIGCHEIERDEIDRIAKRMNW